MRLFSIYSRAKRVYLTGERFRNFLTAPWSAGVILLACVCIAMLLANLPATADYYRHLLETDLSLRISSPGGMIDWTFPDGMTVEKFINDGLMVIFFFSVGLEIKRETAGGQLSSFKKAILPVLAALGGMCAPALIYLLFNYGTPTHNGWGIPTATDIAFAIGILSLLKDRVPVSLKIFLTALAIADDLGAIIVIALFYGGSIQWIYLMIAIALMLGVYLMKTMGETQPWFYLIPAVVIWGFFYYSGIHSTLSGVAMAMLIPSTARFTPPYFHRKAELLRKELRVLHTDKQGVVDEEQQELLRTMSHLARNSVGLSYRLESRLYPWVNFLILPIFALANAGVEIGSWSTLDIFQPTSGGGELGAGIFFGLLLGKPIGIFLTSLAAVKIGLADMPEGANWRMLFAVACLGGIGFTMSIFVDSLAFDNQAIINEGKMAILMGSTAAGILGTLLIHLFSQKRKSNRQ